MVRTLAQGRSVRPLAYPQKGKNRRNRHNLQDVYADTYTMRLWFRRRVAEESEKLFQPPQANANRRDSSHATHEAGREEKTPEENEAPRTL